MTSVVVSNNISTFGYNFQYLKDICNINCYTVSDESEDGQYDLYTCSGKIKKCNNPNIEGNYIVLSRIGNNIMESLHLVNGKFGCGKDMVVINTKSDNVQLTNYIYHLWKYDNNLIKNKLSGNTILSLSLKSIEEIQIPIPINMKTVIQQLDTLDKIHLLYTDTIQQIPKLEKHICDLITTLTNENTNCNEYMFNELVKFININNDYDVSDGKPEGKYRFYTSSPRVLFNDNEPQFNELMLILGQHCDNVHYDNLFSCANNSVYVMKVKEDLTRYIYYYIKTNKELFENQSGGLTISELNSISVKVVKPDIMSLYNMHKLFNNVDNMKVLLHISKKEYDRLSNELFTRL